MNELIAGVGRAGILGPAAAPRAAGERRERRASFRSTGDRGLAGASNSQILRRSFAVERSLQAEGKTVRWVAVGKKGRSTLTFRRRELSGAYTGFIDQPTYADARAIAHRVAQLFTEHEVDRVTVVYNTYVSPLTQRVTEQDVLPISPDVLETDEEERRDDALRGDFIFEPEPEEIMERLLPVYLETRDLPRAPRVGRVLPGRADDGDAERVEERRRAHRLADAGK